MAETLLGGEEHLERFARLLVVDSKLQFWTLNYGLCDAINNELACPVLGTKRTYRGHCGNDTNDPKQTFRPTARQQRAAVRGFLNLLYSHNFYFTCRH